MKRLSIFIVVLLLLLNTVGCVAAPKETQVHTTPVTEPTPTEPEQTAPVTAPEQAPMFSISIPIIENTTTHEDGSPLFTLVYQDMSLILPDPDVAQKIILHYLNSQDVVHNEAQRILVAAQDDYIGQAQWQTYSCSSIYNVKRIDNNVLSLHGVCSSFSGASHPTHITQSINYDLITGNALLLEDILTDGANSDQILQALIAQLETVKEEKQLYSDYKQALTDLLHYGDFSNWYFDDNGISFCFSPYEIAPYVSGIVEATIPYNQLQGILDDAYFPMEWAYEGHVTAELFDPNIADRFTQISELTMHDDGETILLHSADTAVSNVVVEYGAVNYADNTEFQPVATVFACASLTPGDAVELKVALSDVAPVLKLSYQSGATTVTKYIFQSGEDGSIQLIDL